MASPAKRLHFKTLTRIETIHFVTSNRVKVAHGGYGNFNIYSSFQLLKIIENLLVWKQECQYQALKNFVEWNFGTK